MPRTKAPTVPAPTPIPAGAAYGPTLAANLIRLGYADTVVRTAEIARRVADHTGRPISRQRVAQLLGAVRVTPARVAEIAAALGVDPAELVRPARPRKNPNGGA